MNKLINCIAHRSSDGQLLTGGEHTALFDCGMMFCCRETIKNVKDALNAEYEDNRTLDYIFLTHTHYDHIGALPFFRKEFPQTRVVTCETGAAVLQKSTPRNVIRKLSAAAADIYNAEVDMQYSDDLFYADIIVKDNEEISLGGISVKIIFTPGHTRDSLSFYIPELELLIINETPGILLPAFKKQKDNPEPDEIIYPCYLTSYRDTIESINKCAKIPYKSLSMPHRGIAGEKETQGFFNNALEINKTCRDFILEMKNKNLNEEEMLDSYFKRYASEALLSYQPKDAFLANARAAISCTIKEF